MLARANPEITAILREEIALPADAMGSYLEHYRGAKKYAPEIAKVLPAPFRQHSLHTMQPYSGSPVADDAQEHILSFLRSRGHLRGLILCGPPGTGKTALASAWVKDNLTLRVLDDIHCGRTIQPNCHRILAKRWYAEHHAYVTRDLSAAATPPLTSEGVYRTTRSSLWPPLLWIDELDNLAMTPGQRDALDDLVNTIYEDGGSLIVTTNYTPEELGEAVSAKTLRRLTGSHDSDKSLFKEAIDLHRAPRR